MIEIANEVFKNQTEVRDRFESIRASTPMLHVIDHKNPHWEFMIGLLQRHPEAHLRANPTGFRFAPGYGSIEWQVRCDAGWMTTSRRNCIAGRVVQDKFKAAMRAEILEQINAKRQPGPCAICSKNLQAGEIDVDHERPNTFNSLLIKFVAQSGLRDCYQKHDLYPQEVFEDRNYAKKWSLFHQMQATLRILCKSCHRAESLALRMSLRQDKT